MLQVPVRQHLCTVQYAAFVVSMNGHDKGYTYYCSVAYVVLTLRLLQSFAAGVTRRA